MNKLSRQLSRFGVVGLTAAAIHFSVVVMLVQAASCPPLLANVFGFIVAFQASYAGHRWWTFSEATVQHHIAMPKLFTVQIVNFMANESLFYIFLSLHLSYKLALLLVLSILPVFTFLSSKHWVFK